MNSDPICCKVAFSLVFSLVLATSALNLALAISDFFNCAFVILAAWVWFFTLLYGRAAAAAAAGCLGWLRCSLPMMVRWFFTP